MIAQVCLLPANQEAYDHFKRDGDAGNDTQSKIRRIYNELLYEYFMTAQYKGIEIDRVKARDHLINDVMQLELEAKKRERLERDNIKFDLQKVLKAVYLSKIVFFATHKESESIAGASLVIDILFELPLMSLTMQERAFIMSRLPLKLDDNERVGSYTAARLAYSTRKEFDADVDWLERAYRLKVIEHLSTSTLGKFRPISLGFWYVFDRIRYARVVNNLGVCTRSGVHVTLNPKEALEAIAAIDDWCNGVKTGDFEWGWLTEGGYRLNRYWARYFAMQLNWALKNSTSEGIFFCECFKGNDLLSLEVKVSLDAMM